MRKLQKVRNSRNSPVIRIQRVNRKQAYIRISDFQQETEAQEQDHSTGVFQLVKMYMVQAVLEKTEEEAEEHSKMRSKYHKNNKAETMIKIIIMIMMSQRSKMIEKVGYRKMCLKAGVLMEKNKTENRTVTIMSKLMGRGTDCSRYSMHRKYSQNR